MKIIGAMVNCIEKSGTNPTNITILWQKLRKFYDNSNQIWQRSSLAYIKRWPGGPYLISNTLQIPIIGIWLRHYKTMHNKITVPSIKVLVVCFIFFNNDKRWIISWGFLLWLKIAINSVSVSSWEPPIWKYIQIKLCYTAYYIFFVHYITLSL